MSGGLELNFNELTCRSESVESNFIFRIVPCTAINNSTSLTVNFTGSIVLLTPSLDI